MNAAFRLIDLESWPRRRHFEAFNRLDDPHFNLTAPLDITPLHARCRQLGASYTIALVYLLAKTANQIPEFRLRIRTRGQPPHPQVIEHARVHPSFTVLGESELFSFCTVPYDPDFSVFAAQAAERIAQVKRQPTLEDEPGQDDLLFMTAIPWVSFTSFKHPAHLHPVDSVPRIAWGRFYTQGERLLMPLSVQVHHALMDGLHVGKYYQLLQEAFDQADLR